jgi:hypothetical protein
MKKLLCSFLNYFFLLYVCFFCFFLGQIANICHEKDFKMKMGPKDKVLTRITF